MEIFKYLKPAIYIAYFFRNKMVQLVIGFYMNQK